MIPVLAANIRSLSSFRPSAVRSIMAKTSFLPCSPVHALALPLLITSAFARPSRILSRSISIQAAGNLFVVNRAAASDGLSLTMRARSLPFSLMPQRMPQARNALGVVTDPDLSIGISAIFRCLLMPVTGKSGDAKLTVFPYP